MAIDEPLLKNRGLKAGQSYDSAKAQLLKKGWKVDVDYAATSFKFKPPYGFKEVVCGNGRDAMCSDRFILKEQEIMLTLRPEESLVVDGAWGEK